jgi:catechol 2,3-dioxygenase-like lactoylglutathione lyase family enzyme
MISRIHSTTVIVTDQDRALDFFVNTLGFEKMADVPMGAEMRWVTVRPAGSSVELALGTPGWFSGRAPGGPTGISLVSTGIDAEYAALTAKGVRFKGPVEMMPWGSKATWFSDPDGNEFFLVEETTTS